MKILFIAPNYMGLSEPIKQVMKDLGHDVLYLEDVTPSFYPYYRRKGIKRILYNVIYLFRSIEKKYVRLWDNVIFQYGILDRHFDLLFCINGTSLHPYLFDKIIANNPQIKKVLYIWDTNKYYNFEWYLKYFDKAFTFDKLDAKELNIHYLPFYYVSNGNVEKVNYDAFCVGSLHDGRLQILDEISSQMDKMGLNYLFRVVYTPIENTYINRVVYYIRKMFDNHSDIVEREYKMGLRTHKFLTTTPITIDNYNKLISQSRVVIDTDRPSQVGLTPRVIWAIASGKSIITTNSKINDSVYCPNDMIWVIDRQHPKLTKAMFETSHIFDISKASIAQLEIHNWINNFLQFD